MGIGTTALRGIAVFSAVFGAVSGIMFALVLLFVTTVAMLGLFGGAFVAVPVISSFAGK